MFVLSLQRAGSEVSLAATDAVLHVTANNSNLPVTVVTASEVMSSGGMPPVPRTETETETKTETERRHHNKSPNFLHGYYGRWVEIQALGNVFIFSTDFAPGSDICG